MIFGLCTSVGSLQQISFVKCKAVFFFSRRFPWGREGIQVIQMHKNIKWWRNRWYANCWQSELLFSFPFWGICQITASVVCIKHGCDWGSACDLVFRINACKVWFVKRGRLLSYGVDMCCFTCDSQIFTDSTRDFRWSSCRRSCWSYYRWIRSDCTRSHSGTRKLSISPQLLLFS